LRHTITTGAAPAPVAAYAQGSRIGHVVAVSGQVGIDPSTGAVADGVAAQTQQALGNVRSVLQAAGCDLADVVRMDCYLTSQEHFGPFNEVYSRWFPGDAPARATVVVGLTPGLEVEIVALAVTG
jgi:2-iminobutanoate/2-iminopropanoate deaminase